MSYHQGVFTTSSTTTPYDGRSDQLSTVIKQNFYSQPSQNQCALNLRCTRPRTHPSITTPSTRNLLSYLTISSILVHPQSKLRGSATTPSNGIYRLVVGRPPLPMHAVCHPIQTKWGQLGPPALTCSNPASASASAFLRLFAVLQAEYVGVPVRIQDRQEQFHLHLGLF